jgi:hypothetical protein
MKRIIGTVVALAAVLAFGTPSSAATINLAGASCLGTASALAPNPPGYFSTALGAGSNAVVDMTNPANVKLVGGTLRTTGVTDLGVYGTFISDVTTYMYGATGTLSGTDIVWATGATFEVNPASTFGCTGAICGLLGITEGVVYPIAVYQLFTASQGVVPVNPAALGTWHIAGNVMNALGPAVTGQAGGQPAQFYVFAGTVPEPALLALFALVLPGLGGMALRARKA